MRAADVKTIRAGLDAVQAVEGNAIRAVDVKTIRAGLSAAS